MIFARSNLINLRMSCCRPQPSEPLGSARIREIGKFRGHENNDAIAPVKGFLVALVAAGSIGTFVGVADGSLPPGWIMTVGTAHSHSVSMPFSQMTTCPAMLGAAAAPGSNSEPAGNVLSDPIVSFEGLRVGELPAGDNCSIDRYATDDSGAVGFNHYVQVVNTAMVVYDKRGNVLAGPVGMTTFWQNQPECGGQQISVQYWSDAVVRFDRYADRWIVTRPGALPNGQDLCVAVSQTSDPTGAYHQYAFEVNNTDNGLSNYFNDYPKIAVFSDAYYATANPNKIFSGLGNTISAFEKPAMLAGNPDPQFVTFFVPVPQSTPPQITHSHMLAADLEGRRLPPRGSPGTWCKSRIRTSGIRRTGFRSTSSTWTGSHRRLRRLPRPRASFRRRSIPTPVRTRVVSSNRESFSYSIRFPTAI